MIYNDILYDFLCDAIKKINILNKILYINLFNKHWNKYNPKTYKLIKFILKNAQNNPQRIAIIQKYETRILFKDEESYFIKEFNNNNIEKLDTYMRLSHMFYHFLEAHCGYNEGASYKIAYEEIVAGKKNSHWIWYIFPVSRIFKGQTETFKRYCLDDEKIQKYYDHPILQRRLINITTKLYELSTKLYELPTNHNITDIMGIPDDAKLFVCMTIFKIISKNDLFQKVLDKYYRNYKNDQLDVSIFNGKYESTLKQILNNP